MLNYLIFFSNYLFTIFLLFYTSYIDFSFRLSFLVSYFTNYIFDSPFLKAVTLHDLPQTKKEKRNYMALTLPEVFLSRFFIPLVSFQLTSYAFFISRITPRIALPILAPNSISHSCCWPIRCPWS